MRGEFDRLVATPSAREMDAALAEVKVRAVPIARRRARQRRRLAVLGFLALAVGGGAVGRATAPGLTIEPFDESTAFWDPSGVPPTSFTVEPGASNVAVPMGAMWRFHVTAWSELEGHRFNESEYYVEGPRRTGIWAFSDRFALRVGVAEIGDSLTFNVDAMLRRPLGHTPEGLALFGEGRRFERITVRRGGALIVHPYGRPRADEVALVVRIEGPAAAPPARPVSWTPGSSLLVWGPPATVDWMFERDRSSARLADTRVAEVKPFGAARVVPRFPLDRGSRVRAVVERR